MSVYEYRRNGPHYALTDNGEFIGPPLTEIAIAFSRSDGTLHKHGGVTMVENWATEARQKLRSGDLSDWADDLIVLSGPLDIDEINKCISTTGYCKRYYERVLATPTAPQPSKVPS